MRTLLTAPIVIGYSIALGVIASVIGLLDRSGQFPRRLARQWGRAALWIWGVHVNLSGIEHLPAGPAVYAANHGSALDIPVLFGWLPVDFRIIHKRSLYWIPVVGWFLHAAGHIGIDRKNAFRARKSLAAAASRIQGGASVVVFPEGTRSRDERVGHFKRGSFVLALNAAVPVVPVSLVGVKRLVPRGLLSLRRGTIEVRVHPAVPTAIRDPEAAEVLAEEVRRVVECGCEGRPA